jgi:molybdopterin-guanine dinucleotide biosynthesis protein A
LDVSAIVLAGGMSRRLGRNKAVEPLDGEPLIGRVISRVREVAEEAVVVVAKANGSAGLPLPDDAKTAADIYPEKGSLGGIFTGLTHARGDWGVVVACDMPFLNTSLLEYLLSLREGYDAVVPVLDGRPEPTHAAYSKTCVEHIEPRLKADDLKIARFFDQVRVNFVPQEEVERFDPDHLSFFNVNTQQDLERAQALVSAGA